MTAREDLTTAMADLLWERGYAATSPKDVMERAGVGQGSMYHHFAGKHELAVAAFRRSIDVVLAATSVLEGEGDPIERIERYLAEPRPGTQGCRVGRMTQDPQVVSDPELLGLVADAFEVAGRRWERAIAEAVEAGELPPSVVPAELALTLQAVIQGGYVLARARGSQEPMDAAIRGAVALLHAARGPATSPGPSSNE
ncbi:TetR/AcrR family transcriptional regulator [Cellulomonas alba]|uniref:TetR/AcrR family transcriptional regulator n=1 Tax=Cellulomonas alba TaxID=3053467 RepID=A0ABT7SJX4_9CELL|nr:TetR/AcrR family transcriptional regulator [Cellulomonas alba]MDM7856479.1 TetR/AcrR family transcriptional regulator [Cellulomonas alba]